MSEAIAWKSGARRTKEEIAAERVGRGVPATAAQAQLDAIAHPSDSYYRAYLRWTNRFSNQPAEYPSEQLVAESYLLGAEIAVLKRETDNPSESMAGAEWQEKHTQLQRRLGMQKAIADILQRRGNADRNRAEAGRADAAAPCPLPPVSAEGAAKDLPGSVERWNRLMGPLSDAAPTPLPPAAADLRAAWEKMLTMSERLDSPESDGLPEAEYQRRVGLFIQQVERVEGLRVLYAAGTGRDPAEVLT